MSYLGALRLQEMTHIILLLLITRKDTNLLNVAIQETTKHGISERARTTCN